MESPVSPEDYPGGIAQMLWDIEQIKQLKARYFRYMDTRDWARHPTSFTEDCRHIGYKGEGSVMDRYEDYVTFLRSGLEPGRSVHHGHMPEITLTSPTEAEGTWAMFDYVENTGPNPRRMMGYGHYHETYRKEAGEWKISSKRLVRLRVDPLPIEDTSQR
jgi:hypothetical protein